MSSAASKSSKWPRHLLSIDDLAVEQHEPLFRLTDRMRTDPEAYGASLVGKFVALLFLEPSTRTSLSFQLAVQRLGGKLISTQDTSLAKGESLSDTLRIVGSFADLVVLRHPGADSHELAACSMAPIINAGDDAREHPTQALLDLYMIRHKVGRLSDLTVGVGFDPLHSRTERTFMHALSMYEGNRVKVVAPDECQLSEAQVAELTDRGLKVECSSDLGDLFSCEIVYANRFQTERCNEELKARLPQFRKSYRLDAPQVRGSKIQLILDPLPRVDEIDPKVDELPQAAYFEQAVNGIALRMALLQAFLGGPGPDR